MKLVWAAFGQAVPAMLKQIVKHFSSPRLDMDARVGDEETDPLLLAGEPQLPTAAQRRRYSLTTFKNLPSQFHQFESSRSSFTFPKKSPLGGPF